MQENYNFITHGDVSLYVRRISPTTPSKNALLLFNSRSLCVESSMGIPMGSMSYGDYMASKGVETFLIDIRGYGLSSPIQEQLVETIDQLNDPMSIEKYYEDLKASVLYVRDILGADSNITVMGFSYLGTIVVLFANLFPDLVDNVISLNPNWPREKTDPKATVNFFLKNNIVEPFIKTSLTAIQQRFLNAQLPNQDFREPVWSDEACEALKKYHRTFDMTTETWKLHKHIPWTDHLTIAGNMSNITANVFFISSQYDVENPFFLVDRFYQRVQNQGKKYIRILPNATHLCIWETARHTLYQWTEEFINDHP